MWFANETQKTSGQKIAIFCVWKMAQNNDKLCKGHMVWKHVNVSFASDANDTLFYNREFI